MKMLCPQPRTKALTLLELVMVLVVLVLAAGLFLPTLSHGGKSQRITCLSNLKQIGFAFRMWSADHGERFPMAVSTNKEGSLELIGSGAFRQFLAVSNELNSPKVLTCPSDKKRNRASDFASFSTGNLSYFVGLDADEHYPTMILSGDRNVTTNGGTRPGIVTLREGSLIAWTEDIHPHAGNLGLADGSALPANDRILINQISLSARLPVRLEIP